MGRAIIEGGVWKRSVKGRWHDARGWRSGIYKTTLGDPALRSCRFQLEGGPTVLIPVEEVRRVVENGPAYPKDDPKIWGPFSIDPLRKTIADQTVEMQVILEEPATADETGAAVAWTENRLRYALRKHRTRERRLRESKIRDSMLQNDGRVRCQVPNCEIDFATTYGELGYGFAHVHHNVALASADDPIETRLEDLTVVCPNCHAMIHRWMKLHPSERCELDRLIVIA